MIIITIMITTDTTVIIHIITAANIIIIILITSFYARAMCCGQMFFVDGCWLAGGVLLAAGCCGYAPKARAVRERGLGWPKHASDQKLVCAGYALLANVLR